MDPNITEFEDVVEVVSVVTLFVSVCRSLSTSLTRCVLLCGGSSRDVACFRPLECQIRPAVAKGVRVLDLLEWEM